MKTKKPETEMLHDLEVDKLIYQAVSVDDLDINSEYKRIPTDIAYWNILASKALRAQLRADMELDRTISRLRIEHRAKLELVSAKVTESMVDAAVEQDADLETAKLDAIEAKVNLARIRGISSAVTAKKDILQSLGANFRAEMEGSPLLRDQSSYRRRVASETEG